MSLLGSLERSTGSPTLSIVYRPLLDFLFPASIGASQAPPSRYRLLRSCYRQLPRNENPRDSHKMDNVFIQALVRASSCPEHKTSTVPRDHTSPFSTPHHRCRRKPIGPHQSVRSYRTHAPVRSSVPSPNEEFTKEELKEIVDIYDSYGDGFPSEQMKPPSQKPDIEILEGHRHPDVWPTTGSVRPAGSQPYTDTIWALEQLLKDENSSHDDIYELYRDLPFPRVSYLPDTTIRKLLRHLSIVEKRDEVSMIRYLSIVDDMKAAQKPILVNEWTSAIAFASKCFKKVADAEVESALYIFKEMETKAGVKGNFGTFNLLYNIAIKAGKLALADSFHKEMVRRKIEPSRHFMASRIHYYGARKDGNGVRQAYKELVESGHVVDTVVLNHVIAALIKAGEPVAAEHVFLRMKALDEEKAQTVAPIQDRRKLRKLGIGLSKAHRLGNPEELRKLEQNTPIAPNMTTYRLLVRYHANDAGNIDRVIELLEEMQEAGHWLDGPIFYYLLKGFRRFGGVPYSAWTRRRLENIWDALKESLDSGDEEIYLGEGMAVEALLAFSKCAGQEGTLGAWDDIKKRWKLSEAQLETVIEGLRDSLPASSDLFRSM